MLYDPFTGGEGRFRNGEPIWFPAPEFLEANPLDLPQVTPNTAWWLEDTLFYTTGLLEKVLSPEAADLVKSSAPENSPFEQITHYLTMLQRILELQS